MSIENEYPFDDMNTFDAAFWIYHSALCIQAHNLLGDSDEAKDIVQNAFVAVLN